MRRREHWPFALRGQADNFYYFCRDAGLGGTRIYQSAKVMKDFVGNRPATSAYIDRQYYYRDNDPAWILKSTG